MTDDLKPGDIVHVRMRVLVSEGVHNVKLGHIDGASGAIWARPADVVGVELPALKVSDRVRCIGPKGSGNEGVIKAAHDGQFCVLWNGGRLNIHRGADLERCE